MYGERTLQDDGILIFDVEPIDEGNTSSEFGNQQTALRAGLQRELFVHSSRRNPTGAKAGFASVKVSTCSLFMYTRVVMTKNNLDLLGVT
jgi:hypothetical protein